MTNNLSPFKMKVAFGTDAFSDKIDVVVPLEDSDDSEVMRIVESRKWLQSVGPKEISNPLELLESLESLESLGETVNVGSNIERVDATTTGEDVKPPPPRRGRRPKNLVIDPAMAQLAAATCPRIKEKAVRIKKDRPEKSEKPDKPKHEKVKKITKRQSVTVCSGDDFVNSIKFNASPVMTSDSQGMGSNRARTHLNKTVYDMSNSVEQMNHIEDETVIIKLAVQAHEVIDNHRHIHGHHSLMHVNQPHRDCSPSAFKGFDAYSTEYAMLGDVPVHSSSSLGASDIFSSNYGMMSTPMSNIPTSILPPPPLLADMSMSIPPPHQSTSFDDNNTSCLRAIKLLMDFDEKCKNGEWPSSTSVHCYWCCHRFKNVPIGIPLTYNEDAGKFMVYGCFCSCECAAAYNMDSKESSDETMTRYSLINMLARELGHCKLVRPAPNRLVLSMFGGPMSIDEFRERCHTSRLVLVNFPPMMTVTQQVEEINQRELRSEYRYIPIDSERVNKYKEKIKLKRTKPIINYTNTLDHAMNLRFDEARDSKT